MYSAKEKAEKISIIQLRLKDGVSLNSIARELNISFDTLQRWIKEIEEKQKDSSINRTHAQKVDDFLEQIKRDQEEIIQLAAKRVKETIGEANGQVASNVLNTTYNNYRVACGKSNEIIEVRDWTSFIDDLKTERDK